MVCLMGREDLERLKCCFDWYQVIELIPDISILWLTIECTTDLNTRSEIQDMFLVWQTVRHHISITLQTTKRDKKLKTMKQPQKPIVIMRMVLSQTCMKLLISQGINMKCTINKSSCTKQVSTHTPTHKPKARNAPIRTSRIKDQEEFFSHT